MAWCWCSARPQVPRCSPRLQVPWCCAGSLVLCSARPWRCTPRPPGPRPRPAPRLREPYGAVQCKTLAPGASFLSLVATFWGLTTQMRMTAEPITHMHVPCLAMPVCSCVVSRSKAMQSRAFGQVIQLQSLWCRFETCVQHGGGVQGVVYNLSLCTEH